MTTQAETFLILKYGTKQDILRMWDNGDLLKILLLEELYIIRGWLETEYKLKSIMVRFAEVEMINVEIESKC